MVVTENPLSLHSAANIKEIVDQMGGRIRKTYAVTNMIKPRNVERVNERVSELGLELLCQIPYDEELEQMIFENSCIVSTKGLEVWDSIKTIVDTVRSM